MCANLELFANQAVTSTSPQRRSQVRPLADRLRPSTWEQFRGVEKLDARLLEYLQKGRGTPPSLILWGPPGSGKTTLAKLIGKSFDCNFVEFSAVLGGVKEVREIIGQARRLPIQTVLFVDEIHRFNKAQQDAFLPHVENGTIVLIGATTENPSFYLNSALLSRARLLALPELSKEALFDIAKRGAEEIELQIEDAALRMAGEYVAGDARRLLNLLEGVRDAFSEREGRQELTDEEMTEFLKEAGTLFYDRDGEEHYNIVSAFIKSMRGSDPDAALYWGMRMIESGEDPRFVIRRMIIFASEDIGNADPRALLIATATADAFDRIGLPEGKIPIAQCITYLATAPKSNRSYKGMHAVQDVIRENPKISVPLHLRNAPTKVMKDLGYGAGYQYPHDYEQGHVRGVDYLPEEVQGSVFYEPSDQGYEQRISEWMQRRKG